MLEINKSNSGADQTNEILSSQQDDGRNTERPLVDKVEHAQVYTTKKPKKVNFEMVDDKMIKSVMYKSDLVSSTNEIKNGILRRGNTTNLDKPLSKKLISVDELNKAREEINEAL